MRDFTERQGVSLIVACDQHGANRVWIGGDAQSSVCCSDGVRLSSSTLPILSAWLPGQQLTDFCDQFKPVAPWDKGLALTQ